MKKLLLTLIVSLAMCGSIFAQYTSHWPNFYYPAYESQTPFVAAIEIDGVIVTAENHPDNWDALEIAFFVGDECRGAGVAFGDYNAAVNFLYNGYVEQYGDPFPVIDGAPVYYDNTGEVVTIKMYDHYNNIEYTEYTLTLEGEEHVILTGEDNDQGWFDPENPIILHFTTPTTECVKIQLDEDNPEWVATFEDPTITTTDRWTGVEPECWTLVAQYTGAAMDTIGDMVDTLPQLYRAFNTTEGGQYTLRMHFNSLIAMPELEEDVDLANVRLSLNVRQPYWRYKLQIGVLTDIDDPESFVPVAVVNNTTKRMTHYECGFWSVKDLAGAGRHIAFKNIGNAETDPYCTNYLDDVTLTYVDPAACVIEELPYTESFEAYTAGEEPLCWDLIAEDVALESTTRPQVYAGFNTTAEGANTLRMRNRCIYAMPEIAVNNAVNNNYSNLKMTFNLRQPKSVYRLQVGVVDEQGNFTLVKTLKCNSTDMEQKTVNFTNFASDDRIAFRNTLVPGVGLATDYLEYSYNYIDDINITLTDQSRNAVSDEIVDTDLDNIEVYPNPTTGVLYIDAVGVQKVECYSQMGQLVRVYDNANEISLGDLADGVYMLRITVPQGVTMRKVVKK